MSGIAILAEEEPCRTSWTRFLANKRQEVERVRQLRPLEKLKSLRAYHLPRRNFYGAVAAPRQRRPNLIAEIKRSSPSAGLICADFDPVRIARIYADAPAQALSVLTDEKYFGGELGFIERVKAEVGLPVLRKDFLIDPYQLYESRAFGADAVLLIADALETPLLSELVNLAGELGLTVLLECARKRDADARVVQLTLEQRAGLLLGINNRDLKTQRIDLATTEQLAKLAPPGCRSSPRAASRRIRTCGGCTRRGRGRY